jgi:dinuclear metal center YbgI/SA1388 family protein
MVSRNDLIAWCDERLNAPAIADVGVNGLQVAGRAEIRRLAVAVSTSLRTIDAAAAWDADALLVHHGLLWGGKVGPIVGTHAERLRRIFAADLNLIGYHLPLDAHPAIGNNTLLAEALGLTVTSRFPSTARDAFGVLGESDAAVSLDDLARRAANVTEREPTVVGAAPAAITRVAVVTGSGYGYVQDAANDGCQVLVTGDVRESTMAEAREIGVAVIAAGHEATERLGVQALAAELATRFDLETLFISDPNPI